MPTIQRRCQHRLSPLAKSALQSYGKWQTVLPAIWSQRRRDVGCATATVATDANVVTMSPDVALLAGVLSLLPVLDLGFVLGFIFYVVNDFCTDLVLD